MKLVQLKIKNFRSYKSEVTIDIDNLTAFVGKNDIGKSTILEALDIFFNEGEGAVKIDQDDVSKYSSHTQEQAESSEILISATFSDVPDEIVIDHTNKTTFAGEYLLNRNGNLEIIKKYPNGSNKAKVFIKAHHPQNPECSELLTKKQTDLKDILKEHNIPCENKTVNAEIRKSIWQHFSNDLQPGESEIDASKEEAKNIWGKIKEYLPIYFLFQADRKNTDGDSEVQDPLGLAVKEILKRAEIREKLDEVADEIKQGLRKLSELTLDKLAKINPELANTLTPSLPDKNNLKWGEVFKKVSVFSDNNIPINKRGSGVKRMILLSFFQAEAERKATEEKSKTGKSPHIIYAIEEPETSQHFEHQKILIQSLLSLADTANCQILLTTHSSILVKSLEFDALRLVSSNGSQRVVSPVPKGSLLYPSLNEINYIAFGEITEEYHNELYGYIESEQKINDVSKGRQKREYQKIDKKDKNKTILKSITLSEYIRNQIHHPENQLNTRFTSEELKESIELMRDFIDKMKQSDTQ